MSYYKMATNKRLFVGGLSEGITGADIKQKFSSFGEVEKVDIKTKEESPESRAVFAYLNINISDDQLKKCINILNNSRWKGKSLKIEAAKPSFLDRLKKEREESKQSDVSAKRETKNDVQSKTETQKPSLEESTDQCQVLHIRNKSGNKLMKCGPAEYPHSKKTVALSEDSGVSVENLTWTLDETPATKHITASRKRSSYQSEKVYSPPKKKQPKTFNGIVDFSDSAAYLPENPLQTKQLANYSSGSDSDGDLPKSQKKQSSTTKKARTPESSGESDAEGGDAYTGRMTPRTATNTGSTRSSPMLPLPKWLESDSDSESNSATVVTSDKTTSDSTTQNKSPTPSRPTKTSDDILESTATCPNNSNTKRLSQSRRHSVDQVKKSPEIKTSKSKEPKERLESSLKKKNKSSPGNRHKDKSYNEGVLNEFASGECETQQSTSESDDSDLDEFDLIASGQIDKLYRNEPKRRKEIQHKTKSLPPKMDSASKIKDKISPPKSAGLLAKKDVNLPPKTGVFTDMSATEKHKISNEQRLASLQQRQQENEAQKSLVKQALSVVDNHQSVNKKIVFDSDEDSSNDSHLEDQHQALTSVTGTKPSTKTRTDHTDKAKPKLFSGDSSSSESSSEDEDARFKIRPEFEGKHGRKMLAMQSHYHNDNRFKLDARFVESNSDSEEDIAPEVSTVEGADEVSERDRNLQILKDVVGSSALKQKKKEAKPFRDVNTLKYDPTRADHQQFELQVPPKTQKKKKTDSAAKDVEGKVKIKLPEVSVERFFQVSESLNFSKSQEVSKHQSKEDFSLLSMFGQANDEEDRDDSNTLEDMGEVSSVRAKASTDCLWRNEINYQDSSDEEEVAFRVSNQNRESSQENVVTATDSFFFKQDDPRIQEGTTFFRRPEDMEAMRAAWLEKKTFWVTAYKMRRKRGVRNLRSQTPTRGKRGRNR